MRSVIVFAVITLYLLIGVHGYQGRDVDTDQTTFYEARKYPLGGVREWLSAVRRSNTHEPLSNPLLLAECQTACSYLRTSFIDKSTREAYKQCRKKCVQDGLAGNRKQKSV